MGEVKKNEKPRTAGWMDGLAAGSATHHRRDMTGNLEPCDKMNYSGPEYDGAV